ncbi:MAG: hypothetical protein QXM68_04400 [Candidatus Aenigmatarchaeota archaeon]|nr:hypothetical protein [Candidatus Aenigmarchaeota archaeon]
MSEDRKFKVERQESNIYTYTQRETQDTRHPYGNRSTGSYFDKIKEVLQKLYESIFKR